jgi:calcium-dependent protein kinase
MEFDHPNIAKVFEVFEWKSSIAIVMELCEGGDLFTYIKNQRRFTEKTAASIMKQIISGVYYMHKQGVCHRDIKP